MSAAFDDPLIQAVATVVSTEARAFNNVGRAGLDFWTPNINRELPCFHDVIPFVRTRRLYLTYIRSLQGSSVGPRARNSGRGPLPSPKLRLQPHHRSTGRRRPQTLLQSRRRLQTLRGLRPRQLGGRRALRVRRGGLAAGPLRVLPAPVPGVRARREGGERHVLVQRRERDPVVREQVPAAGRPQGLLGLRRRQMGDERLRCGLQHIFPAQLYGRPCASGR